MIITRLSPVSGKEQSLDLDVTEEQMEIFRSGESYIQTIFPNLTPEERDFILMGITPSESESIYSSEEY